MSSALNNLDASPRHMLHSPQTSPQEEAFREPRPAGSVKHCRQCFRKDYHNNMRIPLPVRMLLMIGTLGLFYFVRPCSCTTCGTRRIF